MRILKGHGIHLRIMQYNGPWNIPQIALNIFLVHSYDEFYIVANIL